MPLILITGISTSGKSTIAKELQNRGYEAYDTEHNGVSAWFNKQTGQRTAEFDEMPERTPEWLSRHHWLIDKGWVIKMADKAKDKPIFLCGGAANEPEIRELCQKVTCKHILDGLQQEPHLVVEIELGDRTRIVLNGAISRPSTYPRGGVVISSGATLRLQKHASTDGRMANYHLTPQESLELATELSQRFNVEIPYEDEDEA